jgi:pantoate--beta-alanine ligase
MALAATRTPRPAPRIVESVRELQAFADAARAAGRRIALVPTMGALHAGHLALVEAAHARADLVVVSIFVNPTQFAPTEDLSRYPRPFAHDLAACAEAGVDVVFAPTSAEMYPPGSQTWVEVSELAQPLCGASRPGHFRGVATVVTKLFGAAKPHLAVFGEKDWQQLAVIRRMTRDLCLDVEIVGVPTLREADGLALSSRNVFLAPALRREALCLVRALDAAERAARRGERSRTTLLGVAAAELSRAPHGSVDYAELRDPESLEPAPERIEAPVLLALAVRFPVHGAAPGASVRLIDNRVIRTGHAGEDAS